jgi:hypothetical protein
MRAVVVGAKMGDGYLAYFGKVNAVEGFEGALLALCGLSH